MQVSDGLILLDISYRYVKIENIEKARESIWRQIRIIIRKEIVSVEKIYTIPVNESFDLCAQDRSLGCPFCHLHDRLEENELDLILGASMMEPDIRQKTNELGFCRGHYDKMFVRKNRLGLALILESHLDVIRQSVNNGGVPELLRPAGTASEKIKKLNGTCYVCGRVSHSLNKMIENAVYLWEKDSGQRVNPFEEKIRNQPYFCLPHYRAFIECAREQINKKKFAEFNRAVTPVVTAYFDSLRADISWFCKKFDYRYENEPWGNSKDAIERAIIFLKGK